MRGNQSARMTDGFLLSRARLIPATSCTALRVALSAALVLTLTGCGRKSAPKPPENFAPAPVQALSAVGEVNAVRLTWLAPTQKANGESLDDLDLYVIERAELVKGETPSFDDLGEVVVPESERPQKPAQKEKKTSDAFSVKKPEAQTEAKGYFYRDTTVEPGKRYAYRVIPENTRGTQGISDTVIRITFSGLGSSTEAVASDFLTEEGDTLE